MKNRGVTLTELLIVISIIGILVVVLGFSYQGWVGRYRVESQIKTLYADLLETRGRAMQMNVPHLLIVTATSYDVAADTNENGARDGGETSLPTYPKTRTSPTSRIEYDLGGDMGTYVLDKRGIITPPVAAPATIRLVLPADVVPDYDCIVIRETQVKLGLINAGTGVCDEK